MKSPTAFGPPSFRVGAVFAIVLSSFFAIAASAACVSPASGLVSWWRGEGNADDAMGTDPGVLQGNVTFVPGEVGQALNLNGSDADLRVPASSRLNVGAGGGLTLEGWIKPADVSAQHVIFEWNAPSGYGVLLWIGSAGSGSLYGSVRDTSFNNRPISTSTGVVVPNVYQHVALTYNKSSGVSTICVNGVVVAQTTPGVFTPLTTGNLYWGTTGDLGGTETGPLRFVGQMDELALYDRALTPGELKAIYDAGSAGKCVVGIPPFITTQPTNQTVQVGGSATFAVAASGSPTLRYQWSLNTTNLDGATNAVLALANVQFNQAGNYAVVVNNETGTTNSSNAVLTVVFPPATVRVVSTNAISGGPVTVPVVLVANGNENALGFSLNYVPQYLTYASVSLGDGAPGATLLWNTNQTAAGKLGLALTLPANATFAPGTQEVVRVHFTAPVLLTSNAVASTISFGDQPTLRQLADTHAQPLAANYFSGTVTLAPTDVEGDTAPRPGGNRAVTITDWVQVGRFAARLDTAAAGAEFQRADCAPRAALGNGRITVTDWVQAGRYAAGLDPLTAVGGPTSDSSPAHSLAGKSSPQADGSNGAGARTIHVGDSVGIQGLSVSVPVILDSQGDENALGFSVAFDPARFHYSDATVGRAALGATLNVNADQAGAGKVGIVLALPTENSFAAGLCEVAIVTLVPTASGVGNGPVGLSDDPVALVVSDASANELPADYVAGTVSVNPLPSLAITPSGETVTLTWPLWADGFVLQVIATNLPLSGSWTNVVTVPQTNGGNKVVTVPVTGETNFFRLRHP